ncbi:hypothetical protein [Streptomyces sp. NPDC050982]|uniref:hypothetical protein n=1 Tax=Streptomyces sp. NPDC050982 TaxID=3154746 RepID=UPI0033F663DD
MTFLGGLLMGVTALAGVVRRLDPESRRERRRRTAARRSRQAPLTAAELTREALLAAAVRSTAAPLQPQPQPPAPVTDSRGRLVWWRNRELLTAFDLPYIAAGTVVGALVGFGGVLHIFGEAGRGWFFLVASAGGLAVLVFDVRLVRRLARLATSKDLHPMCWPLLREPDAGDAYLMLYRADDDPDEAPPMLLRLAKKSHARRLPTSGVADVHGLLNSVTVLVPWIDGSPVWTRHPVTTLDLTTERDRGRLTYLKGSETHGQ